jgi:hypothetical protein
VNDELEGMSKEAVFIQTDLFFPAFSCMDEPHDE